MADQSNVKQEMTSAIAGLNMDSTLNQVEKGKLTYALNAVIENFDGHSVNYQNEPGNELCFEFPKGYILNGKHFIPELSKHIFFIVNPTTGDSEIGYMDNNDCVYKPYINDPCLAFDVKYPILKVVHKIIKCDTQIFWTDATNSRRYLNLNELPYKIKPGTDVCDNATINEVDCNKLRVQPNYSIPDLEITGVVNGGNLKAGTVQFAFQYADADGNAYTQYYSITNPTPIADTQLVTANFDYAVGKSVVLNIKNIDISGYYEYFNLAVIKTINGIASVELIGTYFIDNSEKQIIYNGQNQTAIKLTVDDIFRKYPFYDIAGDVTVSQNTIIWDQLTSVERVNYQKIANKIKLQWQTWRIPADEDYSDEINATNLRGELRDEVYPYEIVFLLKKGKETDGFHIPGRTITPSDISYGVVSSSDPDFIGTPDEDGTSPYWKIYNTATVTETNPAYVPYSDYKGPYQNGEFAYWESTELYPCNEDIWGELANKPIRHHKFPDLKVSPIFENPIIEIDPNGIYNKLAIQKNAIFPIGVRINVQEVESLILSSDLTPAQKEEIVGFKIVRGNRDVNKSIIAKGILRNVGKYEREGTEYYFPNYPYNDLREDPFLLAQSNAYIQECGVWRITVTGDGEYQFTNCLTNELDSSTMSNGSVLDVCSISTPTVLSGSATIERIDYDSYEVTGFNITIQYEKFPSGTITETNINVFSGTKKIKVIAGTPVTVVSSNGKYTIKQISDFSGGDCYPDRLNAFSSEDSKYRFVFNSPETSFGQPFLGNVLKVENVIFGAGKGHFVEVEKNALYKLLTKEAQEDALLSASEIADITGTFSATAMFTAYQAYLQIYINGITRKNYGWSYNSILDYDYYSDVENGIGIKQRTLDGRQYLYPGVQSVSDDLNINNYQRESSVYLKTRQDVSPLPFASQTPSLMYGSTSRIEDKSRFIASQVGCTTPENQFDITSVVYYASIKDVIPNQWGQIYSYETIDTGFQARFDDEEYLKGKSTIQYIFGGDTFINKFSFKTKLPFFIDNRVGAPDDSDIYYDEIGNIAYPEYWHSARSILYDYKNADTTKLRNIISIKAHNFDCPNSQLPVPNSESNPPIVNPNRTFYDGKMYMFAYGIPTFYVESSVNVDLRQAYNNREGEFYPHVSSGIPDKWLQESFVPIALDNTYYYNVTFSKQNEENFFSHLPVDFTGDICETTFPFRAIFSSNWLVYKPLDYFDFPQSYGKLTSLDGIENGAVLARFENKSLLYNTLLTIDTSNPKAAYIGGGSIFGSSPAVDFAETDLGYVGSQNKFLLKIPQGQITVDAKRGQIFLISGNSARDISAFGSGLNRFLKDHLPFEILRYFSNVNIDNNFNGIGLHGVYDSKYNRIIISKLDYIPLSNEVKYDSEKQEFYIEKAYIQYPTTTTTTSSGTTTTSSTTSTTTTLKSILVREKVELTDRDYFCNKSWTISFNMNTMSWISFHSYIPNWYIAENNYFYSGLNESCDLEAIAAEIVPATTTTTTTSPVFDCELEGEIQVLDCQLEGNAIFLGDCELAGNANFIVTTTTTTTTI